MDSDWRIDFARVACEQAGPKSEKEKTGSSQSLQTAFGLRGPEEEIGDGNVLTLDHAP
jgi:hypothetical protein